MRLLPVFMCGGAPSRLWPKSRSATLKQFLSLFGDASLFSSMVHRIRTTDLGAEIAAPVVICGADQEALVETQLLSTGAKAGRTDLP